MNVQIRLTKPEEYRETEVLTREAFWDVYKPGCDEHLVLHKLRQCSSFVPELDFVASEDDRVVGHIIYSKAYVTNNDGGHHEVLVAGPFGVLPEYQKKGIGSQLLAHSLKQAIVLGYSGVLLFGNPEYYHRFGFVTAENFQIQTAEGDNFEAFMAMELQEQGLTGITGKLHDDEAFHLNAAEVDAFDAQFPHKEKHVTHTQIFKV